MLSLGSSRISRDVYSFFFSRFPLSIRSLLFLFPTWFMQKAYLLQLDGDILTEQFPSQEMVHVHHLQECRCSILGTKLVQIICNYSKV